MRFGSTLRKSIYPPWKDQYIDYDRLKKLLRENDGSGSPIGNDEDEWTEEDESAFVEELVNRQLEKVNAFQNKTYESLRSRTTACENLLDPLALGKSNSDDVKGKKESDKKSVSPEERKRILEQASKELDEITKEVNELEKYSRINYSGFLKAAKKHDRKMNQYRVRPLLQVRLAALPFNKEDYNPLIIRLSAMFSFVRQSLEGKRDGLSFSEDQTSGESFTSYKFWVHPENLLEVKTVILRRLPVLVYNPQTSKVAEATQQDPTITSIYFDDRQFSLYTAKVDHKPDAASLRLRWYGKLADRPEITIEKKVIKEDDASEEQRFSIKDKYIQPFLKGEYNMEKQAKKLEERFGENSTQATNYKKAVKDIGDFVKSEDLQPMLRANYTRTAFQIPGDDRVRISLDTNLALIREDALDQARPCRDPDRWHRTDIDNRSLEFPFDTLRKGEINRFPYALLEIKIKGNKEYEWVQDLMDSHVVKPATRFSKFVHGVSVLLEDHVNTLPFWLSELETDIRRDPEVAFKDEQERKARLAEDEVAVGSLFGTQGTPSRLQSYRGSVSSPPVASYASRTPTQNKITAEMTRRESARFTAAESGRENIVEEDDSDDDGIQGDRTQSRTGIRSFLPSFSTSKYGKFRTQRLPAGLVKPTNWLKDRNENGIEPKVWLANERTFFKWIHVAVLMFFFGMALLNGAGKDNKVGVYLGFTYTILSVLTLSWGWGITLYRQKLIRQRSGKDFDAVLGPLVVSLALALALCVNFGFKYAAVKQEWAHHRNGHRHSNATAAHQELRI